MNGWENFFIGELGASASLTGLVFLGGVGQPQDDYIRCSATQPGIASHRSSGSGALHLFATPDSWTDLPGYGHGSPAHWADQLDHNGSSPTR